MHNIDLQLERSISAEFSIWERIEKEQEGCKGHNIGRKESLRGLEDWEGDGEFEHVDYVSVWRLGIELRMG